jgi:murein DD-endopeptidase MepM/ murein hydrolase activator NlpD
MLRVLRAIGGWRLAAVVSCVTLAIVAGVLTGTERRRSTLHGEVRWLRARLAEKREQISRQRREMAEVTSAIERVAVRAIAMRERARDARRLANMEESREPYTEQLTPVVMSDADGAPVSAEAGRALAQLNWLDTQTNALGESVAVLTVLLRDPTPISRGGVPSLWPVRGLVTSGFGPRRSPYGGEREMHAGIDIQARYGTPVAVTAPGEVSFAGRDSGYGGLVVVDHGDGVQSLYGHLSALYVHEGQTLHRGQPVGAVGASGRATGSHLHYEVRIQGRPVDPDRYLASWSGRQASASR